MSDLPVDYRLIEKLCTVIDCEHKTAPYVDSSDYLVVRTSNVRNGQLIMEDMKYTTFDGYTEWTKRAVPKYGDVLFTREAPAGESCLVPQNKKVCMGQRMVMLRVDKSLVNPVYLSMVLNIDRTKSDIFRLSIGSTVSRINISDIKKLKIPLPPLPEQRKIAQILSTWDKAIATTEKQIANSKQQKKALMQQLLTGKKRLAGVSGDWEVVKLSQIANITMGSSPKSSAYNELQQGLPLLQGNADIKNRKSAPRIFTSQITKECFINDILLSVRAPVGTVAKSHHHACIGRGIAAITTTKDYSQEFIYQWLLNYEPKWERFSQGSTFEAVNSNDIKALNMLIPPLKEQQKIAEVLTTADNEISTLETQLTHLQQEKKALMQQLLTGKRRVLVGEKINL